MKRIIFALSFLIVASFAFQGCEKEKVAKVSSINTNSSTAKRSSYNPYDSYGIIHNEAMEQAYNKIINQEDFPIDTFSVSFASKKFATLQSEYTEAEWASFFYGVTAFMNDNYFPLVMNDSPIYMDDPMFEPLNLTKYQFEKLQLIFDNINKAEDVDHLLKFIDDLECEVYFNKGISENEKTIIFITSSITKYSSIFANNHFSSEKKPGWFKRVGKKIVKADAGGAVTGIAGGLVDGTIVAATAVGGVAGAVTSVLATATVGAITGSVLGATVATVQEVN